MQRWMIGWMSAALVMAVVGFGGMSSATAQPNKDSGDQAEARQEKPSLTERLRQWFEGERQSMKERAEERGQTRRHARRDWLRDLSEAYTAGYADGYQDAIQDHLSLMLGEEQALERGLSPRQRERLRGEMRDQMRSALRPPAGEFDRQPPHAEQPEPQEY